MAEKKTMRKRILDYLLITVGTVIYGMGVSLFLDPNNLAPGGVTGIAMILNRLTGLPTGTGILLINIPSLPPSPAARSVPPDWLLCSGPEPPRAARISS